MELPNLDDLARRGWRDPNAVTSREMQVLNIRDDYYRDPISASIEKAHRMSDAVPALLAHIDDLHGQVENRERDLEKARFEVTQIAIDTSPAYAQLRNERDSARRERDEAMAKVEKLSARRQEELNELKAKCGQQAAMLAKHCQRRDEVLAVLDRFNTVPADDVIAETIIDAARNLLAGGAR